MGGRGGSCVPGRGRRFPLSPPPPLRAPPPPGGGSGAARCPQQAAVGAGPGPSLRPRGSGWASERSVAPSPVRAGSPAGRLAVRWLSAGSGLAVSRQLKIKIEENGLRAELWVEVKGALWGGSHLGGGGSPPEAGRRASPSPQV